MKSIKVNYIYSMLNTVTGILFPLITFPYASRVLMPEGIGQINFFQSIISYFSLIACLGLPMYALRKTATIRDNPRDLSKTTTEILLLNGILTLLCYVGVFIVCFYVEKIAINMPLFLIMSLSIVLTSMGCEWFYQGIEDFKYIAIRGIIVKLVAAVLLFVFVKTQKDLLIYGIYTVIGSVGGNIFNIIRLRKYVRKSHFNWSDLRPLKHLKGALKFFIIVALTSIYLHTNSVILGFMKTNDDVGYFAAAYRISRIAIELTAALGAVMFPRMSNLISKGDHDSFRQLAQKSYDFILTLALPLTVGMAMTSFILIPVFCGDKFIPAIDTLIILSPVLLFVAIAQVVSYQVLIPQNKENVVIYGALAGLIVNIILNFLFIPRFSQNGAAFATLCTEIIVTLIVIVVARKNIPIQFFTRKNFVRLFGALIMGLVCWFVSQIHVNQIVDLLIIIPTGALTYFIFLLLTKDTVIKEVLEFVKNKKSPMHNSST